MKISRRTFYRRRARPTPYDQIQFNLISSQISTNDQSSTRNQNVNENISNELKSLNEESQLSAVDLNLMNDLLPQKDLIEVSYRRTHPTASDVSAAAVIYKIRRKQNNSDMNVFCDFINSLNVCNAPSSWKSIKRKLKLDVSSGWLSVKICNDCGTKIIGTNNILCIKCNSNSLVVFYHYSIAEQIQHLLLMSDIYHQMQKQRLVYIEDLKDTKYGQILIQEPNTSFTMTLSIDGIVTKNKHISLWPITLIINEIPLPTRRYSESIVLGGVISAVKHPSNKLFQSMLDVIYEQCSQLERGVKFYVPGELQQQQQLKFFLIASCADKPAQSLLTNMVHCNASFSCSKCFIEGENFHEYTHGNKPFTVKVFPYGCSPPRTTDECDRYMKEAVENNTPVKGHAGLCSLTQLKYYSFDHSILFDSLHTLYLGVFKKFCLLLFSKARNDRRQKWSLHAKINSIDEGLAEVKIPTTTSRRFRTIKDITKFKANEFRSLMHHGSTVLLQAMLPKYRRHFALFLAAVNTASRDKISYYNVVFIQEAMKKFVQEWQTIFGLRYMSSNVHSLLHLHQSVASMGPLYMYSTFNFEAIGHDLVTMTHGMTHYGQQLISNLQCYRQAIIEISKPEYPQKLFKFTERILSRKSFINDATYTTKEVSSDYYIEELEHLKIISNRTFIFHEQLIIRNVMYRTLQSTKSAKFSNCCVSFQFGLQIKMGFIRAILKDTQDENKIFVLLENLIDNPNKRLEACLQVKIDNNNISTIPNIYVRARSGSLVLRSPTSLLKKHAYRILSNEETVEIIEYSSLKESS